MARTELTLIETVRAGVALALVDATADGIGFDNASQKVFLAVENTGAGDITLTITTPGSVDTNAIADLALVVPAGEVRYFGPFPNAIYAAADEALAIDDCVWVDTDIPADTDWAAVKFGSQAY